MLQDVLQVASDGRADVVDVDQERVVPCSACANHTRTNQTASGWAEARRAGRSASGWAERVGLGGASYYHRSHRVRSSARCGCRPCADSWPPLAEVSVA